MAFHDLPIALLLAASRNTTGHVTWITISPTKWGEGGFWVVSMSCAFEISGSDVSPALAGNLIKTPEGFPVGGITVLWIYDG